MAEITLKKEKILPTNAATNSKLDEVIAALGGAVNEKLIIDDITTANVTYVGKATIGTAENVASWQIKKLDETTGIAKTFWADGDANYDNIWANRATIIVYN